MGIFYALMGNAGQANEEQLINQYGQLLIEDEKIEIAKKYLIPKSLKKHGHSVGAIHGDLDQRYRPCLYLEEL